MFAVTKGKDKEVRSHHGCPEDDVLSKVAVEVLVEEEEAGADEGRVWEVQLTPGHVGDLQPGEKHEEQPLLSGH